MRPARAHAAGQGRPRARDVRQRGGARAAAPATSAACLRTRGCAPTPPRRRRATARAATGLGRAAAARRGAPRTRRPSSARFTREICSALAARYGLASIPRLDDPTFVSTLVFDADQAAPGTPKRKFAYLFPSKRGGAGPHGARPGAPEGRPERGAARATRSRLVRAAVAMAQFKPRNGATYTVTGAPVVVADLPASIGGSMRTLLVVALLVMAGDARCSSSAAARGCCRSRSRSPPPR